MASVSQRLLVSVTVLLLLFFGVMAVVLDARFRHVAPGKLGSSTPFGWLIGSQVSAACAHPVPSR